MASLPVPLRLLFLVAAVSSSPAIFARDDNKCAAEGLQSCVSQGLSGAFCCEANTTCVALAGKSTVMCCPLGSSCEAIRPITCDVGAQDPDKNLRAPIKTLALMSKLPKCTRNNSCCPFGFTCAEDGELCMKNKDQSQEPEGYVQAIDPAKTATAAASLADGQSTSATASPTASADAGYAPPNAKGAPGPEKTSIIGGAVGGALALLFLAVVIFLCVRSRKRSAAEKPFPRGQSGGAGPYGNIISGPIMNPETSYRTDFLAKRSPSMSSSSSRCSQPSRSSRISRTPPRLGCVPPQSQQRLSIPNHFNSPTSVGNSPAMSRCSITSHDDRYLRTGQVGARLQPIRAMNPSSTRCSSRASALDVHKDQSGESINVFADPSTVGSSSKCGQAHYRETSFSDMMGDAKMGDVHNGQAYVSDGIKHVPGTTPRI